MTCGAGTTTYHSGAPELTPYSSPYLLIIISFLCWRWLFLSRFLFYLLNIYNTILYQVFVSPMENIFIDERIKSIEYLLVIEEKLWSYEVINNKLFKWQWIKLGGTNHLNNLNCTWYLKTHQFYYTFNIFNQLLLFLYPFFCPMV